jgi:Right handed beta helix region
MRDIKSTLRLALILILLISIPVTVKGAIYNVPDDASTITDAIAMSETGDTVVVAPGLYNEELNFNGKSILLRSLSGAEATIIKGFVSASPTIQISNGEGRDLVIDGFTITADYPSSYFNGSGIHIDGASPTIINNVIEGNRAGQYGGGICAINGSSPWIEGNLIDSNHASNVDTGIEHGIGGGICLISSLELLVPAYIGNNEITGNIAMKGGKGGGVYVNVSVPIDCMIEGNTITNNISRLTSDLGFAQGGGVWANCNVVGNHIASNITNARAAYGGGLFLAAGATASDNDVVSNVIQIFPATAQQVHFEGHGAGIYALGDLHNNLVAFNTINSEVYNMGTPSHLSGAGIALVYSGLTITGNTIVGNTTDCLQTVPDGAVGLSIVGIDYVITNNIISYNYFPRIEGEIGGIIGNEGSSLSCNNVWGNEFANYDPMNDPTGTDDNISENPMYCGSPETGPFTLALSSPCAPEANPSCGLIGARPVACTISIRVPDDVPTIESALDLADPGDVIVVSAGIYNEHSLIMKNGVTLQSEDGMADCVTIDAQSSGPVFICSNLSSETAIIGFTLINGSNTQGGAIICNDSDLEIRNCVLASNQAVDGGALYCSNSAPTLMNVTFYGNGATGSGGAVACDASSPVISNTIIAASVTGEAISCTANPGVPTLLCCDLYGNAGGDWIGPISDQLEVEFNFSADPVFCAPGLGNYKIQSNSPCSDLQNLDCGLVGACPIGCWVAVHVPADAPSIQAGIDMANVGATVVISAGTYFEHDVIMKSGIHLTSETGEADCVIIDAEQAGRVLICDGLDDTTIISGLTLTGGYQDLEGGGIYCYGSDFTIRNCVIHNNLSSINNGRGGGIRCSASSLVIENCTFSGNAASVGSGIFANHYSHLYLFSSMLLDGIHGQAVYLGEETEAQLSCTNIYGHAGGDWTDEIEYFEEIDGNISVAPHFCDYGDFDFHLRWCSPCINEECGAIGALGDGECTPQTIRVPEEAATIEDALAMAVCDDVIELACGVYYEHNLSVDTRVAIRSETGYPDCVTIDVQGHANALSISGSASEVVGISFTSLNGGAAVATSCERALVENCSFHGNEDCNVIYSDGAVLEVKNCTLTNNSAPWDNQRRGLIRLEYDQATIRNTIIANNTGGRLFKSEGAVWGFECTDIYGNYSGDWDEHGLEHLLGVDGNICADPLFCFPELDRYNVHPESPCAPIYNPLCGLIGAWPANCTAADVVEDGVPSDFALYAGHPNPVNPTRTGATISFALPSISNVKLSVLDVSGRVVATLVDDLYLPGNHTVAWNGSNTNGGLVCSGVYFCHLIAGDYTATRKLLITR